MTTLDKWKLIFGFSVLITLGGMGFAFGIGRVEEKSSYGLAPIIAILGTMAGGFSSWAFTRQDKDKQDKD